MRYDYECNRCNKVFEVEHSINDKPVIKCPNCNNVCKKKIGGFYFSTGLKSRSEMLSDLNENYGIHNIKAGNCSLKEFYDGVKKDGSRVKEQMIAGNEKTEKNLEKKKKIKNPHK